MKHGRDYQDVIGGGLLLALGLFAALYGMENYRLGTPRHMGPGMFPAVLGFILAGLGLIIILSACFRRGSINPPDLRSLAAVLTGVCAFAIAAPRLGMVPAIVLLTIASSFADNKLRWGRTLLLSLFLSVLAVLIFRIVLGVQLLPFRWNF